MDDPRALSQSAATIARLARKHLAPSDAEDFVAALRPGIRLRHAPGSAAPSRVGGDALLTPGTEWPSWRSGPLSLLMVLDLAECTRSQSDLDLPATGVLNFFYYATTQETWGFDPNDLGSWRVIHADPATARPRTAPPGAETFTAIPLRLEDVVTHPSFEEPVLRETLDHDREACFALEEALEDVPWPVGAMHQIGGWPLLVQGSFGLEAQLASNGINVGGPEGYRDPRVAELEAGADDWVLLAQIDTDDPAGWMWGDAGMLYFAIRRQDLTARAFDKVWMSLQCS